MFRAVDRWRRISPPPPLLTADPEAVVSEWRTESGEPNWGAAWEMFDEGPIPAQRLNVAIYFASRLKCALLGTEGGPVDDDQTAEVCRRVLVLLRDVPREPAWIAESHLTEGAKVIRLALAVMRANSWQPPAYGGNGRVAIDLEATPYREAVATKCAPSEDYLRYFFTGT